MYNQDDSNSFQRFRNMVSRQGAAPSNSDYGLGSGNMGGPVPGGSSYGQDEGGMGHPPMDQFMGNRFRYQRPNEGRGMPRPQGGPNWRFQGGPDTGFGSGEFQGMPRPQGGPNWRGIGTPAGPNPIDPMRATILLAGQNPYGGIPQNPGVIPPSLPGGGKTPFGIQPPWVETPYEVGQFGSGESQAMPRPKDTGKVGWDWSTPPSYAGPWNK